MNLAWEDTEFLLSHPEYIDPNLKKLTLSTPIRGLPEGINILKIFENCHNLRDLAIQGSHYYYQSIENESLKKFRHLQKLYLVWSQIEDIEFLKDLPLEGLTLDHCQIKNFNFLCHLSTLRKIFLAGKNITDEVVKLLENCQNLESIKLKDCKQLTVKAFESLKNCQNLKTIEVDDCDGIENEWDLVLKSLRSYPKLETLKLETWEIGNLTDEGLRCLSDYPSLQKLVLSCCTISDEGIQHLQRCQHLKELTIKYPIYSSEEAQKTLESLPFFIKSQRYKPEIKN